MTDTAVQARPTKTGALAAWQDFSAELERREAEITMMLPRHVSPERFKASAIAAVKQTPGLLKATPRSLFASITKSAQDGLLPDGREGVITVYRTKVKDSEGRERWEEQAQWIPMTHGLRKRARELDGLIVSANVVHERDRFVWIEGDAATIQHEPATLGTDRGAMVGAYAIFRDGDAILHREVMSAQQIEAVRAKSKAPNGMLWKDFPGEAWRKTVIRRGFKAVPCSETLSQVVSRDDGLFDFDAPDAAAVTSPERPKARVVQPAAGSGRRAALPPVVSGPIAGDYAPDEPPADEEPEHDPITGEIVESEGPSAESIQALAARMKCARSLNELDEMQPELQVAIEDLGDAGRPDEAADLTMVWGNCRAQFTATRRGKGGELPLAG